MIRFQRTIHTNDHIPSLVRSVEAKGFRFIEITWVLGSNLAIIHYEWEPR